MSGSEHPRGTKLKPFNADPGYLSMVNTPFGYAVIYDREKGGDWIDADTRWATIAYNREHVSLPRDRCGYCYMACRTERLAREVMNAARDFNSAVDWFSHRFSEAVSRGSASDEPKAVREPDRVKAFHDRTDELDAVRALMLPEWAINEIQAMLTMSIQCATDDITMDLAVSQAHVAAVIDYLPSDGVVAGGAIKASTLAKQLADAGIPSLTQEHLQAMLKAEGLV